MSKFKMINYRLIEEINITLNECLIILVDYNNSREMAHIDTMSYALGMHSDD